MTITQWVCISIVLGAILGSVLLRWLDSRLRSPDKRPWWVLSFKFLLDALVVFGITAFVSELPQFQTWVRREISHSVRDVFADPEAKGLACAAKFEELLDPEYLRGTFSEKFNRDLRSSAILGSCSASEDDLRKSFLSLIEGVVFPMLDQPLREDYNVVIRQTVKTIGKSELVEVVKRTSWTFVNPTPRPIEITNQCFDWAAQPVPGMDRNRILETIEFKVGPKGAEEDRRKDIKFGPLPNHANGPLVYYRGCYSLTIVNRISVVISTKVYQKIEDNYDANWMKYPTKNLNLTYSAPVGYKPVLYVFGLGVEKDRDAPLITAPESENENLYTWRYDGWMFRKHGYLLTWFKMPN